MWRPRLALALVLTAGGAVAAEGECTSPQARAFDFWIGDWTIEQEILQRDGTRLKLPAETSVSKVLGGCAILERWEGQVQFFWEGMSAPERMRGLSVRSWDPAAGEWSIHWMDTRSPVFGEPFRGGFQGGVGRFYRTEATANGKRTRRIEFSETSPGLVRWSLSVSSDDGQTWTEVWTMSMARRAGRGPAR